MNMNSLFNQIPALRLMFYKTLLKYVKRSTCRHGAFLCLANPTESTSRYKIPFWTKYVCWKEMKETKALSNSEHILHYRRGSLRCDHVMFSDDKQRISFLNDCIKLLKEKKL